MGFLNRLHQKNAEDSDSASSLFAEANIAGPDHTKEIPYSRPPCRKIMGKGGCVPPTTGGGGGDGNGSSIDVTVLEKEREEKKRAEPKFYWADDEEPHRRR